jgi:hypothetical protein
MPALELNDTEKAAACGAAECSDRKTRAGRWHLARRRCGPSSPNWTRRQLSQNRSRYISGDGSLLSVVSRDAAGPGCPGESPDPTGHLGARSVWIWLTRQPGVYPLSLSKRQSGSNFQWVSDGRIHHPHQLASGGGRTRNPDRFADMTGLWAPKGDRRGRPTKMTGRRRSPIQFVARLRSCVLPLAAAYGSCAAHFPR